MPLLINRNDITKMDCDAIVNAANNELKMGGGVCGAIFRAAGPEKLQKACDLLSPINTGEAVITPGFNSKAKFIIHTAGPVYREGNSRQEQQLYNCYYNSLKLAVENNLKSIAFPLISSGIYGYPSAQALSVALKAIHDFLGLYDDKITVYMIVYNSDAFSAAQKLYDGIESYIDEKLIKNDVISRRLKSSINGVESSILGCILPQKYSKFFPESEIIGKLDDTFNEKLFNYIRRSKMSNVDVYKNANLDRRLFSKIISNNNYTPSKNTIFALAISLKLNIDDTESLLKSAGYAISHSSVSDLIIEYYITNQEPNNYNIDELNFMLYQYKQTQLGQA